MRNALFTIAAAKTGDWSGGVVNLGEVTDDVAFLSVGQTCHIYDFAVVGKVIHVPSGGFVPA